MGLGSVEFEEYEQNGRKHKWGLGVNYSNKIYVDTYFYLERERWQAPDSGKVLKRYDSSFPRHDDIPLSEVPKIDEMKVKALEWLRGRITL
jgi:hypothetical protein